MNNFSKINRKESKYFINYAQYILLSTLLRSVMDTDENAGEDGNYFVRSLYFDSYNLKDLNEKEVGINHRRKIRFRYYHHSPHELKLEIKEKFNKFTIKKSITITRDHAKEIFDSNLSEVLAQNPKLYDHMLSHSYVPVVIIDYEREAYVSEPFDLRINFDKNIRGTRSCEALFDADPAMIPLIDPEIYILEVKHTGHIPEHIQKILSSVDLNLVSYSKYYYGGILWQ